MKSACTSSVLVQQYIQSCQELAHAMRTDRNMFVPWSTPVLYFGNISAAKVITIGNNPSASEFGVGSYEGGWTPRPYHDRRFVHSGENEGICDLGHCTQEQAYHALSMQFEYFASRERVTQSTFFSGYERLLQPLRYAYHLPASWSGYELAAHLDIFTPYSTILTLNSASKKLSALPAILETGWKHLPYVISECKSAERIIGIGGGRHRLSRIGNLRGASHELVDGMSCWVGTLVIGSRALQVVWGETPQTWFAGTPFGFIKNATLEAGVSRLKDLLPSTDNRRQQDPQMTLENYDAN